MADLASLKMNPPTNRFCGALPKIGIRPTIDGRRQGVRESLEDVTMNMAKAAAAPISGSLRHPNGQSVECVVADTTIVVAEAAACADKFSRENVAVTLTVTPCWCNGSETMDMDPLTVRAVGPVLQIAEGAPPCLITCTTSWTSAPTKPRVQRTRAHHLVRAAADRRRPLQGRLLRHGRLGRQPRRRQLRPHRRRPDHPGQRARFLKRRIPVCMHNVDPARVYRPSYWNAFGMDGGGGLPGLRSARAVIWEDVKNS